MSTQTRWDGRRHVPLDRIPPPKEQRSCRCSEKDEHGRPVFIGWCGPECEGRPKR